MLRSVFARAAFAVLFFAALPVSPGQAATHANRPPLNQGDLKTASSLADFDCGTYGGNEQQNRAMIARYKATKRRLESLRIGTITPPMSFINDDVWVVEDDGTLINSANNPFDIDFSSLQFTPSGSAYTVTHPGLAWDATYGAALGLGDDAAVNVGISHTFPFYGVNWNDIWVNSNGAISFGGLMNTSGFFDDADFFNAIPKIAAYYMDLDPSAGGTVYFKTDLLKTTITWVGISEWGQSSPNTFQVVLQNTGTITISFNNIGTVSQSSGLPIAVGVHPGGGPPLDLIDYNVDTPYAGAGGHGIYEEYLQLTNPRVQEVALINEFYNNFPDEFFQISFFTNWTQTMAGFANELNIMNSAQGIGLSIFDNSASWGSAGVLESRCNMNRLAAWPSSDPAFRFTGSQNSFLTIMGQESGHRWGAFVNFLDQSMMVSNLILGRSDAHWSHYADVDHSSLEGGDYNFLAPGTPASWVVPTMIDHYSDIDQYTFGIRTPEEVKDFYYVSSATNNLVQNRSLAPPTQGTVVSGDSIPVTVYDIIAAEGPRVPAERPVKDLRHGFILLVQNGNTPTAGELSKVAAFRSAWEDYFEVACDGRLTLNTSLTQTFGVGAIGGTVRDKLTTVPLAGEFTVTSVERGFVQPVPGGAHYTFRYMAANVMDTSEMVTLITTAPGYLPDTCVVDVPYDTTLAKDIWLTPIVPSAVPEDVPAPATARLVDVVPNPFNPTTTITYTVSYSMHVRLAIYDVRGHLVRTLIDSGMSAGEKRIRWDAADNNGARVSSGVYFALFQAGNRMDTRKLVFLK